MKKEVQDILIPSPHPKPGSSQSHPEALQEVASAPPGTSASSACLPLESSPPFPWSLVGTLRSPLLSPHPSDISLSGLSHSEMSLELFRSKDSFVRMSHEPLRSKCPKLNSLLPQPGLLPSSQEYHCPLRLSFSKTSFCSLLIPDPKPILHSQLIGLLNM